MRSLWEIGAIDPFELARKGLESIGVKPTWDKIKKLGLYIGTPPRKIT